jgi:hypothetical protein
MKKMIKTPIGFVKITINGVKCSYRYEALNNVGKSFAVDGRFSVLLTIPEHRIGFYTIECKIEPYDTLTQNCQEPGEQLALNSIYQSGFKLSIGTRNSLHGVNCKYIKDGLQLRIAPNAKNQDIKFFIAWLKIDFPDSQDIFTWFAADPTYDVDI